MWILFGSLFKKMKQHKIKSEMWTGKRYLMILKNCEIRLAILWKLWLEDGCMVVHHTVLQFSLPSCMFENLHRRVKNKKLFQNKSFLKISSGVISSGPYNLMPLFCASAETWNLPHWLLLLNGLFVWFPQTISPWVWGTCVIWLWVIESGTWPGIY